MGATNIGRGLPLQVRAESHSGPRILFNQAPPGGLVIIAPATVRPPPRSLRTPGTGTYSSGLGRVSDAESRSPLRTNRAPPAVGPPPVASFCHPLMEREDEQAHTGSARHSPNGCGDRGPRERGDDEKISRRSEQYRHQAFHDAPRFLRPITRTETGSNPAGSASRALLAASSTAHRRAELRSMAWSVSLAGQTTTVAARSTGRRAPGSGFGCALGIARALPGRVRIPLRGRRVRLESQLVHGSLAGLRAIGAHVRAGRVVSGEPVPSGLVEPPHGARGGGFSETTNPAYAG